MPTSSKKKLQEKIIQTLKTIYDPELPVDIYELGLIYEININAEKKEVHIVMTLTTPNCPVAEELPAQVQHAVQALDEVKKAKVELTFTPPYNLERLSETARLLLHF
ncbi:MAG: iron-sulfur cluster assembly protein [Bacteroidota bacterium]